jgi:hypothetical protein
MANFIVLILENVRELTKNAMIRRTALTCPITPTTLVTCYVEVELKCVLIMRVSVLPVTARLACFILIYLLD